MSNLEQMQQNIATFGEEKPLSVQEMDALLGIADEMVKKIALPCTACRYCTTHCRRPRHSHLLALYNEHAYSNGGFIAPMAVSAIEEDKRPNACIGCRSCEAVCPQQIKISEAMARLLPDARAVSASFCGGLLREAAAFLSPAKQVESYSPIAGNRQTAVY